MIANHDNALMLGIEQGEGVVTEKVIDQSHSPSFICGKQEVDVGIKRLSDLTVQLGVEFVSIVETNIGNGPDGTVAMFRRLSLAFSFRSRDPLRVGEIHRRENQIGWVLRPPGTDPFAQSRPPLTDSW